MKPTNLDPQIPLLATDSIQKPTTLAQIQHTRKPQNSKFNTDRVLADMIAQLHRREEASAVERLIRSHTRVMNTCLCVGDEENNLPTSTGLQTWRAPKSCLSTHTMDEQKP
jgi:hypothetical protein